MRKLESGLIPWVGKRCLSTGMVAICVCCWQLLFGGVHAVAAEYYKYKDASGKWVFTDKKPPSQEAERHQMLVTEAQAKALVVNRGSRDRPKLVAINRLAGPVQVWLDISASENIRITAPQPHIWSVPARSELFLTALERKHFDRTWSYQWRGEVAIGPPVDLERLDLKPLALPFSGGSYLISQGFHGDISHNGDKQSFFAIDITMPKGTPIMAVRDGVVMDVESDFSRSGWSEEYADEANYVRLLHEDGTMTVYAHLDSGSLNVGIGQAVRMGERLGHAGNTGFSTGPHLHFAVQVNEGQSLTSIPFQFVHFGKPEVNTILTDRPR